LTGGGVSRHPARIYSRWDKGNGRGQVRVTKPAERFTIGLNLVDSPAKEE